MAKALLFVNGEPPTYFPAELSQYRYIACTDGAYHNYLVNSSIVPHFIIGDLDSLHSTPIDSTISVIHTPDQNKNDFEKSLLFLADKGIKQFDIYGASGRASDHFLGNLSVAIQYYSILEMNFFDNYCHFFFAKNHSTISQVKGKTISLMPLCKVYNVTINGFKYPLSNVNLQLDGLISLRNEAIEDKISIEFDKGHLLIFISN